MAHNKPQRGHTHRTTEMLALISFVITPANVRAILVPGVALLSLAKMIPINWVLFSLYLGKTRTRRIFVPNSRWFKRVISVGQVIIADGW